MAQNWKELAYKIILAIVSVLLSANQIQEHSEHKAEQAYHQATK